MNTWSKTSVSLGYHSEYMHISSSTICQLTASISVLSYNFGVLFFWLFFSLENVTLLVLTSVQRSKPKTRDVIRRASLWLCITHRLVLCICFTVAIFAISFWLQFVLWSFFLFFSLWIVQPLISNLWCHFTTLVVVWIEIYFCLILLWRIFLLHLLIV